MSKAANSAYLIAANAAATAIQFVSVPLLLRWIGKPAYGVYLYVAVVAVYVGVATPGLYNAAQKLLTERFSAGDEEGAWRVQQTQLALALLFALGSACAFVFLGSFLRLEGVDRGTMVAMFSLYAGVHALALVNGSLVAVLASLEMFRSVAVRQSLEPLASAAAALALAFWLRTPVAVVAGSLGGSALGFALNLLTLRRVFPQFRLRPQWDRGAARELWVVAARGWPQAVVLAVSGGADRMLLPAAGLGTAAVADYAIPYRLPETLNRLLSPALATVVPELTRLHATDPHRFADKLHRYGLQSLLLGCALILVPSGFGGPLLRLWLGDQAPAEGAAIVLWIGVYFTLNYYYNLMAKALVAQGRMHLALPFSMFNALATLALTVPMAKAFGIVGLAWMNACINAAQFGVFLGWIRRRVAPEFPVGAHLRRSIPMVAAALASSLAGFALCDTPWAGTHPLAALAVGAAASVGFLGLGLALRLADQPDWGRSSP
ncbi:MAG: oligosaccharide flippase family protein [Fimbriimonadales bacterium]|nr:oligosaccharide flippase family protein [Fimbriimonadales bacterium]